MQLYLLEYGVTKKNVLAANAAMDLKDSDMARGMAYLLTKGLDLRSYENSKQTKSEQNDAEQEFYELSRYTPRLKHLVRDLIQGTLDSTIFPTLSPFKKGKNNHTLAFGTSTPRSTVLSSTRPLWQTGGTLDLDDHEKLLNEEMRRNNGRFIIFVAGGITYSEIRSMYELSEELDVEVLVGMYFKIRNL
jgi:syntaxin-binding protein 1